MAERALACGNEVTDTLICGRLTILQYCGCLGNPGSEDGTDGGEVDLGGVVGVGEGRGDRDGDDAGVPEGEREHVLGAPDEVQSNSLSSPESRFRSFTPATASISRHLYRSSTTLSLKGKLPEASPSWIVWTIMVTLLRILILLPAKQNLLYWRFDIFRPRSLMRLKSTREEVGTGR